MTAQLLPAGGHRRMAWRNGSGLTDEVARSPAEGDFDWRISFADVDAPGDFSAFPGVDRTILVVRGAGMILTIDGTRRRLTPFRQASFTGESRTRCDLVDGPTRDLNVMTRRGVMTSRVAVRRINSMARIVATPADTVAVAVLTSGLRLVRPDTAQETLAVDDVVLSDPGAPLVLHGPGAVAVIRLLSVSVPPPGIAKPPSEGANQ